MMINNEPIRIMMDFQMLTLQKFGGVSRYFFQIYSQLKEKNNVKISIPAVYSYNGYFTDIQTLSREKAQNGWIVRFHNLVNLVHSALYIFTHRINIYHPTYYRPYLLPLINKNTKVVVTVHDMIHEIFHDELTGTRKTIKWKKKCIFSADHIIAVSEWTKKDLLRIYPEIDEEKVSVIYHGYPSGTETKEIDNLPQKYVLFVGRRSTYKNYLVLCDAMNILMENDDSLFLLCVGGGNFSDEELKMMRYPNRFMQLDCSDKQLYYAYKNARCFVFPSKYEGFGIPILEAFVNRCPVILSNASCFPEIGGEAVLYFHPDDSTELAEKIVEMEDEATRNKYIERGITRVAMFTWEKASNATYNVYASLVQ